jgi:uncharacterized membrane protein
MKAKTHKLTETITNALGPIFHENPDYDTILQAMSLVMARVIQATPDKGREHLILEDASIMISDALREFLKLESEHEKQQAEKKAKLDEGIERFNQFAAEHGVDSPLNGGGPTHEEIMAEEAEQAKQDTYKEEP